MAARMHKFKRPGPPAEQKKEATYQRILEQARANGVLNLADKDLSDIPAVFYSELEADGSASFEASSMKWWEVTDIRKIFLQCNKLTAIHPSFLAKVADSLISLDVSDNSVVELEEVFGELNSLITLNLNHNAIQFLPSSFPNLCSLAELNISHNKLSVLPTGWGALRSLAKLNVSHNLLSSLPDDFGDTGSLVYLDLSNNQIQQLPKSFAGLRKLEILDASGNKILPSSFSCLTCLQILKLDRCSLKQFPDISNCDKLKEVSLADNAIVDISTKTTKCFNTITILNLRGNKIDVFPDDVAVALMLVERIDLTNNNLTGIPLTFGKTDSLKSLVLDGNPLKSIRRDVISRGTTHLKQWLVSRIPVDDSVTTKPDSAPAPSNGKGANDKMDISSCGDIENIPLLLVQAKDKKVKDLILSKNRISALDGYISCMPFASLVFLDLSVNLLRELPAEFAKLGALRELNISSNKFQGSLPDVIYRLASLEVLIAADNNLESFDTIGLTHLGSLRILDIRNNSFSTLDPRIAKCPSLKHLEVTGNLFRVPRPEVVRKGSVAILEYLRSKLE